MAKKKAPQAEEKDEEDLDEFMEELLDDEEVESVYPKVEEKEEIESIPSSDASINKHNQ